MSHTLDPTVKNATMGKVTIDPDLLDDPNHASPDPNVPTDANELRRYTDGTQIVLVAEAISGKSFKQWKIFDPNHPGDSGYAVTDTNTTLYLTMDADWEIEASFKCGSSEMLMPLGAALLMLGAVGVIRRLRRVRAYHLCTNCGGRRGVGRRFHFPRNTGRPDRPGMDSFTGAVHNVGMQSR